MRECTVTRTRLLFALATLGAIATIAAAAAVIPESTPGLEGVWRFRQEIDRRADGSLFSSGPAQGYDGLLIFTGNGYMSSTLTPKGRTWTLQTVSPADLRETVEATSAHAGRYEVDTKAHTIKIESIVSLDPAEEGKWSPVQYVLEQDTLSLSGPWTYHGEKLTFTVRLAHVK